MVKVVWGPSPTMELGIVLFSMPIASSPTLCVDDRGFRDTVIEPLLSLGIEARALIFLLKVASGVIGILTEHEEANYWVAEH